MDNFYNGSNLNSILQLFLITNAERDSLNNLNIKRSALNTLIAPVFLFIVLAASLYFLISDDMSLMYLVYIAAPLSLILFALLFLSAAKDTYVIKVSDIEITKKYLLKRKVSINYPHIESAEVLMSPMNSAGSYNESALSFIKLGLAVKSSKETIIIPVFVKGFIEFYRVFKKNFPDEKSQNALSALTSIFIRAGIDLENGTVIDSGQGGFGDSPFEGF